jgi:hypothetical protein
MKDIYKKSYKVVESAVRKIVKNPSFYSISACVLILVVGAFYFYSTRGAQEASPNQVQNASNTSEAEDWKIYTNEGLGIEFSYPSFFSEPQIIETNISREYMPASVAMARIAPREVQLFMKTDMCEESAYCQIYISLRPYNETHVYWPSCQGTKCSLAPIAKERQHVLLEADIEVGDEHRAMASDTYFSTVNALNRKYLIYTPDKRIEATAVYANYKDNHKVSLFIPQSYRVDESNMIDFETMVASYEGKPFVDDVLEFYKAAEYIVQSLRFNN